MTQTEALLLSIAIEAPVAAALIVALRWGTAWRAAAAATVGTLATHWAVWPAMYALAPAWGYTPALLLSEGAVVAAETLAYRCVGGVSWRRAAVLSLAANAASTLIGLLIHALD